MRSNCGVDGSTAVRSPTLELQDNLSYRLSILNFLMGKVTQGIHRPAGLTSHQWKVLSVLYAFEPMLASQVERWVTLDKAAISRAVHQLRKLGLAERKVREADRRSLDVVLTRKGRDVYSDMARDMAQIQAKLFKDIDDDRIKSLFNLMNILEARLNEELTQTDSNRSG